MRKMKSLKMMTKRCLRVEENEIEDTNVELIDLKDVLSLRFQIGILLLTFKETDVQDVLL